MDKAKKTVNLTIPLSPFFPIGSVFPWDAPFHTEDITSYKVNAARLFYISMGSDTGTRLMGPGLFGPDAPKVDSLALDTLVNRSTILLSIPKAARQAIDAEDVERAFSRVGAWDPGDAVLLATGWGDQQRWKTLGENYALESPYLTLQAAECLLTYLEKYQSNLFLTDCAYLERLGDKFVRWEWMNVPPWQRPAWPSEEAQAYLRHFTRDMAEADWVVTRRILQKTWAIAGLANCGSLPSQRLRITCLPMFVQEAGEAPCTVIAEI